MKKGLVLSVLLLAVACSIKAQYSDFYYHRTGDTIEWRSEIGYYAWWEFEFYYDNNLQLEVLSQEKSVFGPADYRDSKQLDSAVVLARFFTPTPLRIVGLAAGSVRGTYPAPDTHLDTDYHKEYLMLYDATPNDFPLLGQLEWNPFDPHRTVHIQNHRFYWGDSDSCCKYAPVDSYFPIYEYYFDSVITVTDSFYVGGTFFGDSVYPWTRPQTQYFSAKADPSFNLMVPCMEFQAQTQCKVVPQPYKIKAGLKNLFSNTICTYSDAPWRWYDQEFCLMLIYPLIEVDTTVPPADACVPVENVQVAVDGTSATVTWDDFPNYTDVRLRYGFASHPQSAWTEVDVTGSALHTLTGLQPSMPYGVTVRAMCDKGETEWSAPVTFVTGTDTTGGGHGTEGVDETMLSRLTFLQPNPARDAVTVTSSFNLSRIEIFDLQGVMVFSEPVYGHDVTLPLDYLRAGTYIVGIHTHNGTTHKRLVVL